MPAYLPRWRTATLSDALSLPPPLSLICVTRPAVSNHSLSVTLNLICKCDMWGQRPVLCVHCSYTRSAPTVCSGSVVTAECDYFHHVTQWQQGFELLPAPNYQTGQWFFQYIFRINHTRVTSPKQRKGTHLPTWPQRWKVVMATKALK